MISYLRGTVLTKTDRSLILVVGDSTGYRIHATPALIENASPSRELELFIHTHVREDALELFGFTTIDELSFFEQLISISGVGPKTALGVLSVAPLADIKKAIIHGDPKLLQRVSSIGKKTAERIIVELKEKISVTEKEAQSGMSITENVNLMEALQTLGYRESEIRRALNEISPETKDLSERIKEALKLLSQP